MAPLADRRRLLRILETALRLPTAPFAEHAMLAELDRFADSRPALAIHIDPFGNRMIHYRKGANRPAIAFAAHTDHPGLVYEGPGRGREGRARYYGGGGLKTVQGNHGKVGVRFFQKEGDRTLEFKARIIRAWKDNRKGAALAVRFDAPAGDLRPGWPGMWDLVRFSLKNGRVYGRALDDLAGVSAMVSLLDHLCRNRSNANVYCLFTRAEEVGFVGALAALGRGGAIADHLSKEVPIISLEASQSRPGALIGEGPVLRVGDRMSVFDPSVTAYLQQIAQRLGKQKGGFPHQRQLIGGGSCEATAFQDYGRPTGALCVSLGNYHNIKPNGGIGPEFIGMKDLGGMTDWMIAASLETHNMYQPGRAIRKALDKRMTDWRALLKETAE